MKRIKERVKKEYKIFRKTRYFWFVIVLIVIVFLLFFVAPVTVERTINKLIAVKFKISFMLSFNSAEIEIG